MLPWLFLPLADELQLFNLFRYLTFRTGGAIMTSLVVCFFIGPKVIRWLKARQGSGQPIRTDGPETHLVKKGTPTMGGVMILISLVISTLLWADITGAAAGTRGGLIAPFEARGFVLTALAVTLGYGLIGFGDDYLKLTRKNPRGLPGRFKLLLQIIIALAAGFVLMELMPARLQTGVAVPFLKDVLIGLGVAGFILFAAFVIVGASNAVNFTDGLDGLATVPVMIAAGCFGLIAYLAGNAIFAEYLQINFVPGAGELAVFCGALVGSCLGFLWFNAPPAQVFMGDTGSLAMGGALGAVGVATKHEIVLAIVGGLFVLETISVIVQVASFKLTGKRVFRMAPIHHHFEKLGWSEPTVVVRFWIISAILAMIGLATLKLR